MKPVRRESRTWFGIEWYATEDEADCRGTLVLTQPHAPTAEFGRHPTYDRHDKDTGAPLFAVIVP